MAHAKFNPGDRVNVAGVNGTAVIKDVQFGDPISYRVAFSDGVVMWIKEAGLTPATAKPKFKPGDRVTNFVKLGVVTKSESVTYPGGLETTLYTFRADDGQLGTCYEGFLALWTDVTRNFTSGDKFKPGDNVKWHGRGVYVVRDVIGKETYRVVARGKNLDEKQNWEYAVASLLSVVIQATVYSEFKAGDIVSVNGQPGVWKIIKRSLFAVDPPLYEIECLTNPLTLTASASVLSKASLPVVETPKNTPRFRPEDVVAERHYDKPYVVVQVLRHGDSFGYSLRDESNNIIIRAEETLRPYAPLAIQKIAKLERDLASLRAHFEDHAKEFRRDPLNYD